jgi:hypothetical protein
VKALSIFLLICFSLVLTPRQWWHQCSHSDHKKSTLSHKQSIEEDCPVCDLSLSVFTSPASLSFRALRSMPFVHDQMACTDLSGTKARFQQLRAPPHIKC